jgi:RNA polymerase sigma factor (sigma-70 family)
VLRAHLGAERLPLGASPPGGTARVLQHRPLADPPPAVSAETVVLGGEEREDIIRALRHLSDRQREVLVLRFYAELPAGQIARMMGIRPGTGRSTAFRRSTPWAGR